MSKKNRKNKNNDVEVEEVVEETTSEEETVTEEHDLEDSVDSEENEILEAEEETEEISEDPVEESNEEPIEDEPVQEPEDNTDSTEEVQEEETQETVEIDTPVEETPVEEEAVKGEDTLESLAIELKDKLTIRELAEWTLKDQIIYKETGVKVKLSKRNNYKVTRTRPLNPSKWSIEELMDWLEDDVVSHPSVRTEAILEEIYNRWSIPSNWTEEAAKDYVINNKLPEETDRGVLKQDRRRKDIRLQDHTYAELCSMYVGDIESSFSQSEVKRRIMLIARILDDDKFDEIITKFKEGKTHMSSLSDQLIGVLESRKELYRKYGSRVTDVQLATNTTVFYNTLRTVMKAESAEFAETWRTLLKFVDNNYTGVFSPAQIRRGWANINLSVGHMQVLDRLLTLIMGTRVAATRRQDIKLYKLDYILENINNQKERDNIISFYTAE